MFTLYVLSKKVFTAEEAYAVGNLAKRCRSTLLGPERGKRIYFLFREETVKEAFQAASLIQKLGYTTQIKRGLPV